MIGFLLRRLGILLLTMLFLASMVFWLTNLPSNLTKMAKSEASVRMTDSDVALWLGENGYDRPLIARFGEWLGVLPASQPGPGATLPGRCMAVAAPEGERFCGALQGHLGSSTVFDMPVTDVILPKLAATGWLMLYTMLILTLGGIGLGVIAGIREGSLSDSIVSTFSIGSTATPDYVWAVLLVVAFASATSGLSPILKDWGLIETPTLLLGTATSAETAIDLRNFTLPVLAIGLYGMGYIASITRASMVEVMRAQYIRTARLKGLGMSSIVLRHALRNALIVPVTVIMLQFPWLLNGVVIVEIIFNYKGFGWLVVQAAGNNDIELLMGCAMVAAVIVLITQLLSDIAYTLLNPRLRLA
ncbi:MAG: ABC transporter permease [Tabrizicola flagellatus]|uniref:ABC transporter permease n=1 Tax=Tabrizicola flagellatus TaxID=2593021 RepID=UPI00391B8DC2